ncbi:MAG: hypothetical protein ACXW3D_01055 [Caulobacteraceae bacterium]
MIKFVLSVALTTQATFVAVAAAQQTDGAISTAPTSSSALHAGPVYYGPPPLVRLPSERLITPIRDPFVPDDGKPHGEVSAMIGTGGTRGLSGCVTVKPKANVTVGIAGAYYEGPVYYPGYGPDPGLGGQSCGRGASGYLGERTEVLKPLDEPATPSQ